MSNGINLVVSHSNQRCCSCGWHAQHEFIANSNPKIVLFACDDCFEKLKKG